MANVKKAILKKKIEGVLYDLLVKTSADLVQYDESSTVAEKLSTALSDIADLKGGGSGSIDEKIAEAIKGKADKSEVISAIVNATTDGAITITKGEDTSDLSLRGVVTKPTWDEDQRKLTLPYLDSKDGTPKKVEMTLGKDMVVKEGRYEEASQELVLVLTDDSEVKIPAGALVDIYTGKESNSTNVTVSEDNEISVDVKISSKENNAVSVETENPGLYVKDLSPDIATLTANLGNKVDKDGNKQLSEENFTSDLKRKLEGLSNFDIGSVTTDNLQEGTTNKYMTAAEKTKLAGVGRIIMQKAEPEDLDEKDLFLQDITEV